MTYFKQEQVHFGKCFGKRANALKRNAKKNLPYIFTGFEITPKENTLLSSTNTYTY